MNRGIKTFKVLLPSPKLPRLTKLIESKLSAFVASITFNKIMVKKKGETQHSTAFSLFMGKKQELFAFQNEIFQKGNHKIDVGVYDQDTDELIFTIEAKVLPTPKGSKNDPRDDHEYVYRNIGKGAGIERFKNSVHGLDTNEDFLPENGMIAYIKEQDFDYWHCKVNLWITGGAKWDISEILNLKYPNRDDIFISTHSRTDGSTVILHHFWVKV